MMGASRNDDINIRDTAAATAGAAAALAGLAQSSRLRLLHPPTTACHFRHHSRPAQAFMLGGNGVAKKEKKYPFCIPQHAVFLNLLA